MSNVLRIKKMRKAPHQKMELPFEELSPHQIHISTISIMEIEHVLCLNPERAKKIRPIWNEFLNYVQILPFSESCAKEAANIRADLKNIGQLIGPFDILIAGTALAHHLILVSSNLKEFNRIKTVISQDWR